MSQFDYGTINPNTKSGTQLASDLNDFRDALHSNHLGTSQPSYVVAGMVWGDNNSANYIYKAYDGSDDIPVFQLDATNDVARVALDNDGDSYIVADTDDLWRFVLGGLEKGRWNATSFVVGALANTGDGTLHVWSASAGTVAASSVADDLTVENNTDGGVSVLTPNSASGAFYFGDPEDNDAGRIVYDHSNTRMELWVEGVEALRVDGDQTVIPQKAARSNGYTTLTQESNGDIEINLDDNNNFELSMSIAGTLQNPSNIAVGQSGVIVVTQDSAGGNALTFDSYYEFAGGTAPSNTTTGGATDIFAYEVIAATTIVIREVLDVQ